CPNLYNGKLSGYKKTIGKYQKYSPKYIGAHLVTVNFRIFQHTKFPLIQLNAVHKNLLRRLTSVNAIHDNKFFLQSLIAFKELHDLFHHVRSQLLNIIDIIIDRVVLGNGNNLIV